MSIAFCSHPPAGRLVDDAELAALPYPVRQVGWAELVETSDFLSVHVPLAPPPDTWSTHPSSRR
jgi:glyoxylate reductase